MVYGYAYCYALLFALLMVMPTGVVNGYVHEWFGGLMVSNGAVLFWLVFLVIYLTLVYYY